MLDVLVRTETTVESMARASRARASATMGTPEECAKFWTTLVKRLTVDSMATVLKGVASAQNDTRGPSAMKPHVVQQYPPSTAAASTAPSLAAPVFVPPEAAAASAPKSATDTPAVTGVTTNVLVGTARAPECADPNVPGCTASIWQGCTLIVAAFVLRCWPFTRVF